MLLIDNRQTQILESHMLLNQGMGPHQNLKVAVVQIFEQLSSGCPFDLTG